MICGVELSVTSQRPAMTLCAPACKNAHANLND